ncbi:MAG: Trm112 family protein [Acidimicrobiia bacterium]|nr:Trm112 family protein [Acidimicrobiia bacterium]
MSLISPELLAILRCPRCQSDLVEDEERQVLTCESGHDYPVIDGIPDMVIES